MELFLFIVQFILVLFQEPKSPSNARPHYDVFKDSDVSIKLGFQLSLVTVMSLFFPQREPCPEESAPFFSRITWWWQNRYDQLFSVFSGQH